MRKLFILMLYRILPAAAFPLLLIYVVWRCLRDPRYFRRVTERFGFLSPSLRRTVPDSVWLHAVSVGEVLSSIQLIRRLRAALPGAPIFVSCSTLSGREVAESRLAGLVDGVFFSPIDYVSVVRRVLRHIRPAVVIVLETEIWPNLYREVKKSGSALVVVNGRISPKALPRYRRLAWFFRTVLTLPDAILVQSEEDQSRYVQAGAPEHRVIAAGNLKYDFDPRTDEPPEPVLDWLRSSGAPLWIAASTVAPEYEGDVDEDDCVLDACRRLRHQYPALRLLVAPRKPERFEAVATKLQQAGLPFLRRSNLSGDPSASIMLLDSLGELGSVFPYATVVFMGGTLADRGGHNILEPAISGRPVIVGPHLENFAEIQRHFRAGDGFREIAAPSELAAAVQSLLDDPEAAAALGARARMLAEAERGATARAIDAIVDAREQAIPRVVSYGPLKPLVWFLCLLWRTGGTLKRNLSKPGRLRAPVVGIGGLAMGGAGKTPMVRYLARRLSEAGVSVAILTRGYRRKSPEPITILPRGSDAPVSVTGDEAQTILCDRTAHLGISADRFAAGRMLEARANPDIFLLDDGFQHARIHKDIEIVLLDGLDPFAGGYVFPRGRLREPISALSRADAVVITRAGNRRFDAVRRVIRSANPTASIFTSSVVPQCWVDARTGQKSDLDAWKPVGAAAFCGLANPNSFLRTLEELGYRPAWVQNFPDHHVYSPSDLDRLASRSASSRTPVLLTTEKDAVKLPEELLSQIPDTAVHWLSISIRIDPLDASTENDLLHTLQSKLKVTNP